MQQNGRAQQCQGQGRGLRCDKYQSVRAWIAPTLLECRCGFRLGYVLARLKDQGEQILDLVCIFRAAEVSQRRAVTVAHCAVTADMRICNAGIKVTGVDLNAFDLAFRIRGRLTTKSRLQANQQEHKQGW